MTHKTYKNVVRYFSIINLSLVVSGCMSPVILQYNQKFLNEAYALQNMSSQGRATIEGYCKTTGAANWEDSYQCQTAVTMAAFASDAISNIKTPHNDIVSAGNAAVTAALKVSQGYVDVWRDAIEHSAHNSVYDKSINFDANDALRIASRIASSMGAVEAIHEADASVLNLAKSYGVPEATAYAIAVHTVVDLGTSPRGSLVSYAQQIQTARTQWESAKTALSLRDIHVIR